MKKLMTMFASAATLCAFGVVNAEGLTSTGFETAGYVAGQNLSTTNDDYGNASGAPGFAGTWVPLDNLEDGVAVVTAYGSEGAAAKGDVTPVAGADVGDNYLKLDSAPLISRYAQEGGTALDIGDGLYIDTLVQFTAADPETAPETAEGDKLCIWLAENTEDPTQCTLMIGAGYVADDFGYIVPTNYATTTSLANNSWHRLQVKVLSAIDSDEGDGLLTAGFVVFIDGTAVATATCPINSEYISAYTLNARAQKYMNGSYSLFPSLVDTSSQTANKITSLSFSGSGAVDNLSFTQGADIDPIVIAAADMPKAKEGLVETTEEQYGVEGNLEDEAYVFGGVFKATVAGTYTATATLLPGYVWTDGSSAVTNIEWTIAAGGGESGFNGGEDGKTFSIDSATQTALESKLPSDKKLTDVADATSGMTYAQAYALGLLDEDTGDVEDLDATISIGADGKVTVSLNATAKVAYVVTLKVFEKASLTADWPVEATHEYGLGSSAEAAGFTPGSATSGFYKVKVVIEDKPSN